MLLFHHPDGGSPLPITPGTVKTLEKIVRLMVRRHRHCAIFGDGRCQGCALLRELDAEICKVTGPEPKKKSKKKSKRK